ncbi:hypothetical protein ACFLVX_00815 [Chloroflexota bacterium]
MKQAFKYSFIACAVAYFLIAIPIFILFAALFRGSYEPIIDTVGFLSFLTLMLSSFSWWGEFYYLAFLVPWLTSTCILALLINHSNRASRSRALLTGLSVFIYYFAMLLVFMIQGFIFGWGDVAYDLIWIWPVCGFLFGCAAALIVQKGFKLQV